MGMEINYEHGRPLYLQAADFLRNRILSGAFSEQEQLPPEPELARQLNINRMTLRRSLKILHQEHLLEPRKRQGTIVTYPGKRTWRIGVLYPQCDPKEYGGNWFSLQLLCGLQQAFDGKDCELMIKDSLSEFDLIHWVVSARLDGLVVAAPDLQRLEELKNPFFDRFPLVLLNVDPACSVGHLCVDADPDPLRPAMEVLFEAGCRRIAYIGTCNNTSNSLNRRKSFLENLRKYDLEEVPELIFENDKEHLFYIGYHGAERLLKQKKPPDGLICSGPEISLGAWMRLSELGMKIPHDISVIGFNVPFGVNPMFSTLLQQHLDICCAAGDMLLALLRGETDLKSQTFVVRYEERGSVLKKTETQSIQ